MHYVFPYVRASKASQEASPKVQCDRIKQWFSFQTFGPDYQLHEPFIDAATSSRISFENRPYGGLLLGRLREGDVVVVTKCDRAFRSAREALNMAHRFTEMKVRLMGVDQNIDTATSDGMIFFTMLAGFAQWERSKISERTKEGLDWRKARGFAASGGNAIGWATKRTVVSGTHCSLYVPDPKTRFPALLAQYLIESMDLNPYKAARCLFYLDVINTPHSNGVKKMWQDAKSGFTRSTRKPCQERHDDLDNELRAEIVRIFGKWSRDDWMYLYDHRTFPNLVSADARKLKLLSPSVQRAS